MGTYLLPRLMECVVSLKQEGRLDAGVRGKQI